MTIERKKRILVFDDDLSIISFLREILETEYVLKTATSGEEALSSLSSFQPDIVLLDVMMPGINGYETCRRIKSSEDFAHIKILFLSAKVTLEERLNGYNAGGDDYVTKPFESEELLAKIKVFEKFKHVEQKTIPSGDKYNDEILEIFYKIQRKIKDILYIKSDSPYCMIYTDGNKEAQGRIRITIQALEDFFRGKDLVRVHRSYLINSKRVLSLNWQKNNECKIVLKDNLGRQRMIPVGRSYHGKLKVLIPSLFSN